VNVHGIPLFRVLLGSTLPCPNCGGELTEPRQFNLMFETSIGAVRKARKRLGV
jgi:glycyl-tRNA synthetase (class II)